MNNFKCSPIRNFKLQSMTKCSKPRPITTPYLSSLRPTIVLLFQTLRLQSGCLLSLCGTCRVTNYTVLWFISRLVGWNLRKDMITSVSQMIGSNGDVNMEERQGDPQWPRIWKTASAPNKHEKNVWREVFWGRHIKKWGECWTLKQWYWGQGLFSCFFQSGKEECTAGDLFLWCFTIEVS